MPFRASSFVTPSIGQGFVEASAASGTVFSQPFGISGISIRQSIREFGAARDRPHPNTASALDLARLLARLQKGEILRPDSQKTLSQLLGVDPKWFQPKKPIDPNKLIDSTLEKLAQVNGKARTTPPVAAKPGEQSVLVLSFNPIRPNPASSKEVKQFLDQRKDRKPNAVPLLIILRTPEG